MTISSGAMRSSTPSVVVSRDDHCPAVIAVRLLDLLELVPDDPPHLLVRPQDRLIPLDLREDGPALLEDLLPLEARQPLELEVQNGLRLDLREAEPLDQARASRLGIGGAPDERDHSVQVVERDPEPLQNVRPLLRLPGGERRPPDDDLVAVPEEDAEEVP